GLAELPGYLAAGAIAVGVGGPLVGDAASGGDLDALRERARAYLAATS
ncbi:aldolase, partial [Micromonospora globispora]